MDITRRNFLKLAVAGGLVLSTGSVASAANEKILVAYFSRTGEEYGLGMITKGNTAIAENRRRPFRDQARAKISRQLRRVHKACQPREGSKRSTEIYWRR